jgi:hypothetical protein
VIQRAIVIDACVSVLLATAALILAPGLGVVALIAVLVVFVCVVSLAVEAFMRRRRRRA